ncbi:MAG: tetratricopeptide repeat protein [Bacteroidetes bacterium]|nr:tetratricopeptide repeat protein [Bacteroidota bacterium]
MLNRKILYIIIGIVSFAVYYNSLSNAFVFDDESVIENNSSIQSLSNIPKFFTADEGFHKVIGRYYRPLTSALYTVDYAVWGLDPYGFHLTNALIHVISCLLLFAVLLRFFGGYKNGLLAAFIGSLIFAVHPVHTEAVSWISGRTDSLVTLFFFASFLLYMKFTESDEGRKPYLYISLLFYILGLLSKEMIVTMPVFILLYDFVYRKKDPGYIRKNITAYVLFAAVTVVFLFIRYMLLKDIPDRTTYFYFYGKSAATAFYTMLTTIPVYFKLLFYPVNLLYHYNGTIPDAESLGDFRALASALFILVLIGLSVFFYKKQSIYSFIILFFLVSMLPVMNIIPTMNFMAERFLYISSFSLSLLAAFLFVKYANERNIKVLAVIFVIIAAAFAYLTYERNAEWKDNDTLYSKADGIDGNVLLVNAGNIYANKKNYDEAEKRYRRAIEIRDNSVLAHHNLGLIFLIKGKLDSAEVQFRKGIEIDSLAPDGYFQLGNVYQQEGRIPEAISMLEKLQSFAPNYRNSGDLLAMLRQKPSQNGSPDIPANRIDELEKRSFSLYQQGKYEDAIKDLNVLLEMSKNGRAGYYNNIGICYDGMGNLSKAKEYYRKSIEIDSANVNALGGMAYVFLRENNKMKAIEYYEKVLAVNPNDEGARFKLDSLNGK